MSDRETVIQRYMKTLDLTREEAEQLWQDDQEDVETDEMRQMAENAKANGLLKVGAREMVDPKGKRKPRKPRDPDTDKRDLIDMLFNALDVNSVDYSIYAIKAVNPEREITFKHKENDYSITLTRHRPPKK